MRKYISVIIVILIVFFLSIVFLSMQKSFGSILSEEETKDLYEIQKSYIALSSKKSKGEYSIHIVSYIENVEYMYTRTIDGETFYGSHYYNSENYFIYTGEEYFLFNIKNNIMEKLRSYEEYESENIFDDLFNKLNSIFENAYAYQAYKINLKNEMIYMTRENDFLINFNLSNEENYVYTVFNNDQDAIFILYNWSFNPETNNNDGALLFVFSEKKDISEIKEMKEINTKWMNILNIINR